MGTNKQDTIWPRGCLGKHSVLWQMLLPLCFKVGLGLKYFNSTELRWFGDSETESGWIRLTGLKYSTLTLLWLPNGNLEAIIWMWSNPVYTGFDAWKTSKGPTLALEHLSPVLLCHVSKCSEKKLWIVTHLTSTTNLRIRRAIHSHASL